MCPARTQRAWMGVLGARLCLGPAAVVCATPPGRSLPPRGWCMVFGGHGCSSRQVVRPPCTMRVCPVPQGGRTSSFGSFNALCAQVAPSRVPQHVLRQPIQIDSASREGMALWKPVSRAPKRDAQAVGSADDDAPPVVKVSAPEGMRFCNDCELCCSGASTPIGRTCCCLGPVTDTRRGTMRRACTCTQSRAVAYACVSLFGGACICVHLFALACVCMLLCASAGPCVCLTCIKPCIHLHTLVCACTHLRALEFSCAHLHSLACGMRPWQVFQGAHQRPTLREPPVLSA